MSRIMSGSQMMMMMIQFTEQKVYRYLWPHMAIPQCSRVRCGRQKPCYLLLCKFSISFSHLVRWPCIEEYERRTSSRDISVSSKGMMDKRKTKLKVLQIINWLKNTDCAMLSNGHSVVGIRLNLLYPSRKHAEHAFVSHRNKQGRVQSETEHSNRAMKYT